MPVFHLGQILNMRHDLSKDRTDEAMIPEELIGTWVGQDGDGLLFLTLERDGSVTILYDAPDASERTGTFHAQNNRIEIIYAGEAPVSFHFLLAGDKLSIAREGEENAVVLNRYHPTFPESRYGSGNG